MHFVVHWEFFGPPSALPTFGIGAPGLGTLLTTNPTTIGSELQGVLAPYSWARPMTNFYVVQVNSSDQYTTIANGLFTVARKYPAAVYLIVSPIMAGGNYTGQLPQNMWPELNKRVT